MKTTLRALRKVLVAIFGVFVIIIGVILLPLPGPGWLIIITGLVILSTEFEWAARWRDKIRAKLDEVVEKAKSKRKSAQNTNGASKQQRKRKDRN